MSGEKQPEPQQVLDKTKANLDKIDKVEDKELTAEDQLKIEKSELKALYKEAYENPDKPTDDQKLLQKAIDIAIKQAIEDYKEEGITLTQEKIEEMMKESSAPEVVSMDSIVSGIGEKLKASPKSVIPETELGLIFEKFGSEDTGNLQAALLLPYIREIDEHITKNPEDEKSKAITSYFNETILPAYKPDEIEFPLPKILSQLEDGLYGNDTHSALLLYMKWKSLDKPAPVEKPEPTAEGLKLTEAPKDKSEKIPEGAEYSIKATKEIMNLIKPDTLTHNGVPVPVDSVVYYKIHNGEMQSFVEGMYGNLWKKSDINVRKSYQKLIEGVIDEDRTHAAQGEIKQEIAAHFNTTSDAIRPLPREALHNGETTIFLQTKIEDLRKLGFDIDRNGKSIKLNEKEDKVLCLPKKEGETKWEATSTVELGDTDSKLVGLKIAGNTVTVTREKPTGQNGMADLYQETYVVVSKDEYIKSLGKDVEKTDVDLNTDGKKTAESIKVNLGLDVKDIKKQNDVWSINCGEKLNITVHLGRKGNLLKYIEDQKDKLKGVIDQDGIKSLEITQLASAKPILKITDKNNTYLMLDPENPNIVSKQKIDTVRTVGSDSRVSVYTGNLAKNTSIKDALKYTNETNSKINDGPEELDVMGRKVKAYRINKDEEPEKYSLISQSGARIIYTPDNGHDDRFVLDEPRGQDIHINTHGRILWQTLDGKITAYEGNTEKWSTKKWTITFTENSPYSFKMELEKKKGKEKDKKKEKKS